MGTITLSKKIVRKQNNGWQSPAAISGNDYISYGNNAHVIYTASVDMTGSSALTGLIVKTNFVANGMSSGSHSCTLKCYVYDSDPSATSPTTVPTGYIACSSDISATIPYYGLYQTFNVTFATPVTESKTLYIWFTDTNPSSYADYLYSTPTGNGVTQTPTISGDGYWVAATKTLSISPETVTTGGKLSISIANPDATMTAVFKYGNTQLGTATIYNGSGTVTCPKSWFNTAGVIYTKSFNIAVTISGTSLADDFDLVAGEDCNPEVTSLTATIVQPSSPDPFPFPSTYIANLSKVKLAAAIETNTDANVSSVVFSYPGGTDFNATYNASTLKWEATMPSPITADTTFTATVTDQRGLTGTETVSVTGVVPYTQPSVTVTQAYRCDSSGTAESGGQYYRIQVSANYYHTATFANTLSKLACKVKNTTTETTLTNNTLSAAIDGSFSSTRRYTIVVIVKDQLSDEIEREVSLEGIARNFVMQHASDGGTHIGVGMTPEHTSGACTIELPSNAIIYVGGVPIGSSGTLTQVQVDWNQTDPNNVAYICNKPTIPSNAEDASNKKDTITGTGSSTEYTSTKCVYDLVGDVESILEALL